MSAPVFSYAQAARGIAPLSQGAANGTNSTSGEQGPKETATPDTVAMKSSAKQSPAQQETEFAIAGPALESVQAGNEKAKDVETDFVISQAAQSSKIPTQQIQHPTTTLISDTEASSEAQSESATNVMSLVDVATRPKSSEGDNTSDLLNDIHELDKVKEGDEDWEKVSIPSIAAEKELRAAPIPVVNIWQQRKEAQEAKLKETPSQRPVAVATIAPKSKPLSASTEDNRRKSNKEQSSTETNTSTARRVNSGSRPGRENSSNQTSPRTLPHRGEKVSSPSAPPSVADVESWPTPEIAQTDDRRRPSVLEKSEKTESSEPKSGGQKNKWTPVPFVPSVKFETQLPPAAQSRRGGRPANRARGGLGGQSERSSDKADTGSMGPPPVPKQGAEQDRGRKNNGARANRASSVPTDGPRTVSAEPNAGKFSMTPSKDHDVAGSNPGIFSPVGGEHVPEQANAEGISRSPSRKAARNLQSQRRIDRNSGDLQSLANGPNNSSSPQGEPSRTQNPGGTPKSEGQENMRGNNDPAGDRSQNQGRDWTRDRSSTSRDKSESWRERQPRQERGRGGFRGRGQHGTFSSNASSSHPYTAPLPQNGFEGTKGTPSAEPRSRQSSQPFGQSPSFSASRNNPRSHSIPVSMVQGGFYQPIQGFPPSLSPIQTELNYGPYSPMHSGILSAMPYQDQLGSFALMSMVVTQVEYYFSLDNLCKDMFLRRNMDSQGFVPLRVIGEFRRIKALLGEGQVGFDQLRNVCQQARNIELAFGEENEILLRSRENWRDFVLPMEERLPTAQNEGPNLRAHLPYQPSMMAPEFSPNNVPMRSPPPQINGMQDSFSTHMPPVSFIPMTGFDRQSTEQFPLRTEPSAIDQERRSSTTSPLSKIQSPSQESSHLFPAGLPNGHHSSVSLASDRESTFPDESVAVLKVVVRDPDYQGDLTSEVTNDSSDLRVSGLRGGFGNAEQLDRVRGLQFGQNIPPSRNLSDQTIYWTQGEGSIRPGYVHEEYLTLRDKGQSQRAEKHFDGALLVLYPLWADFLPMPHQFNVSMYEDFKTWAMEDHAEGNENGKKHLVRFYDTMLTSKTPMTERVATDIVAIARQETGSNRPVWHKLRAAWRNGATNFKTRKRLTDLLSPEEQTELDRGA